MSDLPKGWVFAQLGDIVNIRYGKDLSTKQIFSKEKYPVFGANSVIGFYKEYMYEESQVLISCRGAYSGKINYSPPKCFITHNSLVLEIDHEFKDIKKYLFYVLQSIDKSKLVTGSAQPQVTINNAILLELPFPPLNEQRRIVAKLEKLLHRVDACKERLNKIPAILKRFRQSVLAAACSGRLTADWREKNNVDFEKWSKVKLEEVADMRLGKMLDKAKNIGIPTRYLRNLNVRWFAFELTDLAFMRVTAEERNELAIKDGDLLVCEGGEPGRCAVWNLGKSDLIFQKAIHRIRPNENLLSQWIAFNIKNDADSGRLDDYFTGTTIRHLTGKALAKYKLPLPPHHEQHEIVRRVEALFKKANEIEARYKKAKAFVDKLTQSILAKAFRDELVPQDPNDEPALFLLEKIRAEKLKHVPNKRENVKIKKFERKEV